MFNNLIESSSHTREFKRRGSFFIFTIAGYALLFAAGGLGSIYAYDAKLDEQTTELTMLTFVPAETSVPDRAPAAGHVASANANPHNTIPSAPVLYESPNNPHTPPVGVSTAPNPFQPYRPGMIVGPVNNPLGGGPSNNDTAGPGGPGGSGRAVEMETPPPPADVPTPAPKKIIHVSRILNSQAISLPRPPYPMMAKQIHLSGSVSVQVVIDENGRVISAHSVSGHALLTTAAEQAARQARFSPTLIGDTPVKVSGIIVYNFMLQ